MEARENQGRADYATSMTERKNLLFGVFFLVSKVQEGIKQPTAVLNMIRDFESKIMGYSRRRQQNSSA